MHDTACACWITWQPWTIRVRSVKKLVGLCSSPILLQVYNADRDSHTLFYGESPSTQKFLLRIMGVFLGLAFVGITAELIYRIVRKPDHKVKSGEGMTQTWATSFYKLLNFQCYSSSIYNHRPSRYKLKFFLHIGVHLNLVMCLYT